MIIGIGTRRGVSKEEVIEAVRQALEECGKSLETVTSLASAKLKENERGLLEAANDLGLPIEFVPDEVLNSYNPPSKSQASRFGLKGVSEPAAMALSKEKELIFRKRVYGRVTIAIAK